MANPNVFPPLPVMRWLAAATALVLAPHAQHLPLWLSLAALAMIAWRWAAAAGRMPLPSKWTLALLLVASAAGVLLQYHTLFGRDPGVAVLTLTLALKLLETRTLRDAMLCVFLGYFLVITGFFYSQSIPIGLYLLAVVVVLTATLVVLNHPASALNWRRPLRLSLIYVVQAVPLMLVLFVLYPRIPGPLWGLPLDAYAGMTGLSEEMAPGSVSRLVRSEAVAFRAEFAGPLPPSRQLYWRAQVLEQFDGRRWSPVNDANSPAPAIQTRGDAVRYTVTIEPHNKHWVFALELPDRQTLPSGTRLTAELFLRSEQPLRSRVRYALASHLDHQSGTEATPQALARNLQLPPRGNPQTRALAQQLRQQTTSDAELVAQVLQMFNQQGYVYTLRPPPLGREAIDDFLFTSRSGFCEHYASAFTFLMRAAGVPARVVGGYQGGEFNATGNYLIVRQSDAHAWSEVWLQGRGWVRVDPTAAVSIVRIESGIDAALPAGEPLPFFVQTDLEWLRQLRLNWDTLNNQWNQWVLNYDQEQQTSLFSRLGFGIVSQQQLVWALSIGMAVLLALIAALVLRQGRKPNADRVQALYLRFCLKLAKAGLPRQPAEGPLDYAARVRQVRPELTAAADAITRLYIGLRYKPVNATHTAQLAELAARVRRFKVKR